MAQLNDLLVTGNSRFLNEINGQIDWSNVLSKPTIPAAANNGTLTIQKNGTNVQTFTANQNTNATANITVPTKVSELTNDSGYTTNTGTVTQVKVGSTAYNPTSGVVSLPAYPTNTDEKVTQTETSTNANYELLFSSSTADGTTHTEGARKDDNLRYNPSSNTLQFRNTGISNSITPSSISLSNSSGGSISIDNTNNKIEVGKSGTSITYSNTDVVTSNGNTWDGSNTSLKSALAAAVGTDEKVAQTATITDANYEVLLSGTADNTTRTEGAGKSEYLTFNPYDCVLTTTDGSSGWTSNLTGYDINLTGTNNTWDGTNTSLKDALANKLSLSGGTMTGAITTVNDKWYTSGEYSIHLNNSDIIGVNGIWFSDLANTKGEGIMFARTNGNWDDLYSYDGSLRYCTNRTTTGERGSYYTILHTGNGVSNNGGTYTGGNKTAGFCMHGVGTGHTYACEWGSNLAFWVDITKVATVSDRRLKDDIEPINMNLVKSIAECPSYQYKAFNRNGLISVGIIAQDLVENCKKYGVDPLKYELIDKEIFIEGDDTLYYHIEYDQLLYFKTLYLEQKVKELEEKLNDKIL